MQTGRSDLCEQGAIKVVAFPHASQHLGGEPARLVKHLLHEIHVGCVAFIESGVQSMPGFDVRARGHVHQVASCGARWVWAEEGDASTRRVVPLRQP